MNIPEKIKVGGMTYKVVVGDFPSLAADSNAGEILYIPLEIHLRKELAPEFLERVFIHEVLHAIYNDLGYKEHDEKQIDEMAGALHALIKDNAGLFEEEPQ